MPLTIVRDYREFLIDIFFAIIVAVGLELFYNHLLTSDYLHNLDPTLSNRLDFESIFKIFSTQNGIAITFDILFFFVAYFWVISHWVFYHELITKYPYYRWRKFFVDIALFSIMFFILNISYSVHKYAIMELFVWLITAWYIIAYLWHLSDWDLRPLRIYLKDHTWRLMTYIPLLFLLYVVSFNPLYRHIVMMAVIVAMIVWSVRRLSRFLNKDSRKYLCCLEISPKECLPGELELISYPMKTKIGGSDRNGNTIRNRISVRRWLIFKLLRKYKIPDLSMDINGRDRIIFCGKKDNFKVEIFPENIKRVWVERVSDDLKLRIIYTNQVDGTAKDVEVLFNLADMIIGSVRKGIHELSERNKHGDSTEMLV